MGCHSWMYRKVTSFTKEDLNKRLNVFFEKEMKCWIGSTPREEYAKELFDDLPHTLKCYENDKAMCDYLIEEQGTYEKCLKVWDDWHDKMKDIRNRIDDFCKSEIYDPKEYYDIIKTIASYSCDVKEYKGDYYILFAGNEIFRCHKYLEDRDAIESEEEMIEYLEGCGEYEIVRWDNNDEREFGLTDKIRELVKDLFKNNDTIVQFG